MVKHPCQLNDRVKLDLEEGCVKIALTNDRSNELQGQPMSSVWEAKGLAGYATRR